MIMPRATYRLQFRNGMTFERAASSRPYLARLGISHLYASPIFQAEPGSTHGYDVVDYRCSIRARRRDGLRAPVSRSCAARARPHPRLRSQPHGGAPRNPWWRDVLECGRDSAYAQHFDIDWTAPHLILPVLAKSYGEALEAGELGLFSTSAAAASSGSRMATWRCR